MANNAAKNAAGTSSDLSDTTLNPSPAVTRGIIHIHLVVDGTPVTPASIYAALDAQYPTVQSEKSVLSRGDYIFNIGP